MWRTPARQDGGKGAGSWSWVFGWFVHVFNQTLFSFFSFVFFSEYLMILLLGRASYSC